MTLENQKNTQSTLNTWASETNHDMLQKLFDENREAQSAILSWSPINKDRLKTSEMIAEKYNQIRNESIAWREALGEIAQQSIERKLANLLPVSSQNKRALEREYVGFSMQSELDKYDVVA